jgi:hypothetical protein
MPQDLHARLRRLEDRAAISEVVIKYGAAVDQRDWAMFAACFTDPVDTDYSGLGSPAREWARDAFVENIRVHLSGFTATQHISPNHIIEFDEQDLDRALCRSYMYAQHYLEGSPDGDFYLARGSYDNHMLRTADGWQIERIVQRVFWHEGNTAAVAESAARFAEARTAGTGA